MISERLLESREYHGSGYQPLVDYSSWRVAILNFADDLRPENITKMQRHNETDEVFVLLKGRCILFVGEGESSVNMIHAQDLLPHTIYNVKKAVWHHHTLSEDAMVLVVENCDTTFDNSPFCPLTSVQQLEILSLTRRIWSMSPA
ncbi:MAG: hypothetical protein KJ950_15360 [Proteobacteria bacterium]|nr:hypothetical protein [Pseudomonadota bacterium]MBU1686903.1 hypothetical protein [Pseudomonadota bacterium]